LPGHRIEATTNKTAITAQTVNVTAWPPKSAGNAGGSDETIPMPALHDPSDSGVSLKNRVSRSSRNAGSGSGTDKSRIKTSR
jgi:hypothetical protein